MTGKEITKEIKRYLEDQTYNYAVLIDGEWGCGKTYYVKNELKESIIKHNKNEDSQKVIYISLYGCKTLQDIYERFLSGFLKELPKIKNKKHYEKGFVVAKTFLNGLKDKIVPNTDVYRAIVEIVTSNKNIYIFDDLERCDCPINEVFGFLNLLVEHLSAKTIIIANEKEIKQQEADNSKEIQFLVASNPTIVTTNSHNTQTQINNNNATFNESELESRRKKLFPKENVSDYYKSIKEKLVGITLQYEPNILDVCQQIINKSNLDESLKKLLVSNLDNYCDTMNHYNHNNFRTFQFYISKMSILFSEMSKLNLIKEQEEHLDKVRETVAVESFIYCVRYKSNYKPYNPSEIETSKDYFSSIDKYIRFGTFLLEDYQKDISRHIDIHFIFTVSYDDPSRQLRNCYYLSSEEWCNKKLSEIKENIVKNKYPIVYYNEIVLTVQILLSLGFDDKIMEDFKEAMIKNIKSSTNPQYIDDDMFYVSDADIKTKTEMIIKELNEAVKNRTTDVRVKTVKEILESENSGVELETYINENFTSDSSWSLFSLTNKEEWVKLIFDSSIENLSTFRRIFGKIYQKNYSVMRASEEDIAFMKELINKCNEQQPKDLIKKNNINWFKAQLEKVVSKYEN